MLRPRLTLVRLPASLLADLLGQARSWAPLETGGVLMGYRANGACEVEVIEAIGPGPAAEHERRSFRPDAEWQRAEVARRYHSSGRTCTYLGDWHTHPEGGGLRPSSLDRKAAREIARAPGARAPRPLMLIVAPGAPDSPRAAVFEYRRGRLCPCRLELQR